LRSLKLIGISSNNENFAQILIHRWKYFLGFVEKCYENPSNYKNSFLVWINAPKYNFFKDFLRWLHLGINSCSISDILPALKTNSGHTFIIINQAKLFYNQDRPKALIRRKNLVKSY